MASTIIVPPSGSYVKHAQVIEIAQRASDEISALQATLGAITVLQIAGGTFASGTCTINTGIIVTANTDAFIIMSAVVTGSVNVGGFAHLKASNSVGIAGVGSITLNVLGSDGAKDTDAAGAFRVLLVN